MSDTTSSEHPAMLVAGAIAEGLSLSVFIIYLVWTHIEVKTLSAQAIVDVHVQAIEAADCHCEATE